MMSNARLSFFKAGPESMRSFASSSGTDLGVWYSKRHGCWTRISVHLYNP